MAAEQLQSMSEKVYVKAYACKVCNKIFKHTGSVNKHYRRMHSDMEPASASFACEVGGKGCCFMTNFKVL